MTRAAHDYISDLVDEAIGSPDLDLDVTLEGIRHAVEVLRGRRRLSRIWEELEL